VYTRDTKSSIMSHYLRLVYRFDVEKADLSVCSYVAWRYVINDELAN